MSSYPILVERYKRGQASELVCLNCGAEMTVVDPGQFNNDGCYRCSLCGGEATYKFEEAERCKGCSTLGHYEEVLDYCCSRVCQLQAQYIRELGRQ